MKQVILILSFMICIFYCKSQKSSNDTSYMAILRKLSASTITQDSLFDKKGQPRYTTATITMNNKPTMKVPDCTIIILCPCK